MRWCATLRHAAAEIDFTLPYGPPGRKEMPSESRGPSARAFHTCTVVKDVMYLIGGRTVHRMSKTEFFSSEVRYFCSPIFGLSRGIDAKSEY